VTSTVSSKVNQSEQGIVFAGFLVFATVTDLLEQAKQYLKQHKNSTDVVIDCTAIERIDSAGIALLLELHRQTKNNKQLCRFEGLPEQAQSLVTAYHLKSVLLV